MKETEKKILEAAFKLFSDKGYNGVSTKQIAELAGVNEITIFRNFKSKSNLLQFVIKHYCFEGNIIEKIKSEITDDVKMDLYIITEVYYKFLENNIRMFKIQLKEIDEEGEKFTNSIEYNKFVKAYLEKKVNDGMFKGDPEYVASSIVTMVMGAFTFEVYASSIYNSLTNLDIIKTFIDDMIFKYCDI